MASYQLQEWCLDTFGVDPADSPLWLHRPDFQALPNVDDGGQWWFDLYPTAPNLDGVGGIFDANANDLTGRFYRIGTYPALDADQWASCTVRIYGSANAGAYAGVALRCLESGTATCYALLYSTTDQAWKLFKQIGAVVTTLATYNAAGQAIPNGGTGSCSLRVNGTSLLAVTMNVPHTPVTDAAIAGPGWPAPIVLGHHADTASTGIHVENWLCGYLP